KNSFAPCCSLAQSHSLAIGNINRRQQRQLWGRIKLSHIKPLLKNLSGGSSQSRNPIDITRVALESPHPIPNQRETSGSGLLRMKLGRRKRTVFNSSDKLTPILCSTHNGSPKCWSGFQLPLQICIAVHKIEFFTCKSSKELRLCR